MGGRIPELEREIKCSRMERFDDLLTFYVDASKRYYTVVFVEKTLERDALDVLVGSTVEEEVPTDFGVLDVREHFFDSIRLCKQYPTEVHDPHQCNQFLNSMMQVHGPESDTEMFLVVDMHISNYLDALVYRSPKHSEYYGDYQNDDASRSSQDQYHDHGQFSPTIVSNDHWECRA